MLLCVQKLCANIKWRLIDHQKSQRCGLHVHEFVIVRSHSEPKSFCRCRLTGALATASGDDAVRVFKEDETANPEEPVFSLAAQVARAHNQDVNCVSWNPKEAGFLASCSDDGEIAIWKFQEEE